MKNEPTLFDDQRMGFAAERRELERLKRRQFPIQDGPSVPWEVMAPYEAVANAHHGQTLRGLAVRGGLSAAEAWAVVSGYHYTGQEAKEQWSAMRQEWFRFAERVNLHFGEFERLRKQNAAMRLSLEALAEGNYPGTPINKGSSAMSLIEQALTAAKEKGLV